MMYMNAYVFNFYGVFVLKLSFLYDIFYVFDFLMLSSTFYRLDKRVYVYIFLYFDVVVIFLLYFYVFCFNGLDGRSSCQ